jgi:uncharacterized protein with ParB-like and HNH nuclease domain
MPQIEFSDDGVGHFISDNFLKVPIYQRPYSWDKQHVEDFINDVKNSSPDEYFIGTMVLAEKDDFLEIIDGQQRLATLTIFYAALRNYSLKVLKDEELAKTIEAEHLFKRDKRTKEIIQRLILGEHDNEFFLKAILERQNGKNIEVNKNSHKKLIEAYGIIYTFINNEYNAHGKNSEHLLDLEDFIEKKVKIIIVQVDDESNAFTIFETLNDRGLKLSQADLIKNFLFEKSKNRIAEAQQKWTSFTSSIESAESEPEILEYIRYHLSSKEGLTREKELFKKIKNKITNTSQAITYLSELENDVQFYLMLLNPNHVNWNNDYHPNCRDYVKAIKELKLSRNRPLLLAILKKFSKKDIEKSLKLLLSWSVRNLITFDTPGGTLEIQFSEQAKLITNGTITSHSQLKKAINHLIPTNDTFKKAFEIANVSKNFIARYYLSEIEKTYHSTSEQETSKNTENVNLEHVLPEKADLSKDWKQFSEEQHKSYCHRIGNLTLMDKEMNSNEKSGAFNVKKNAYNKSEVIITKNLHKHPNWTTKEIEERQKEFALRAIKIWNI